MNSSIAFSILDPRAPVFTLPTRDFGKELTAATTEKNEPAILQLFEDVKKAGELDVYFCSRFIESWRVLGNFERATQVWNMMKRIACTPNEKMYAVMIKACSWLGTKEQTISYFQKMIADGLKPDAEIFASIIHATAKESLNKAFDWYERMQSEYKVKPTQLTCKVLITSCVSDPQRAVRTFHALPFMPDSHLYEAYFRFLSRSTEPGLLFSEFARMEEKGITPSPKMCLSYLRACKKTKDCDRALALLNVLQPKNQADIEIYNRVITIHARVPDLVRAKEIYNKALGVGLSPTMYTYNAMMTGYVNSGSIDDALTFMKSWELAPDNVTLKMVVAWFVQAKRLEEADTFFDQITASGVLPKRATVITLMNAFDESNNPEKGRKYALKLRELTS